MPTIKSRSSQVDAIAGGSMESAADLGVLFGCHSGVCGKCATTVVSGLNNMSEPTDEEKAMDLDPERRAAFVLVELEGLAGKEVAELLGKTDSSVYRLLHEARTRLRRSLREVQP